MSHSHTADAIPSAHEPIAAWTTRPWGFLGEWGHGVPWCVHSPPSFRTARLTPPGPPPSGAVSLPSSPRSVAAARRFSRGLLAEWGLDELADDTVLLLSELVTNAIVHVPEGAGEVRLALSRTPAQLVVQVTDGGGRLPLCAEAGLDSENGRGMWLVEQLAAEWGHHTSGGGKTIWFTLPLPGAVPLG